MIAVVLLPLLPMPMMKIITMMAKTPICHWNQDERFLYPLVSCPQGKKGKHKRERTERRSK
jgi:hypothetical protein